MSNTALEAAAAQYDRAATELEQATRHLRDVSAFFRAAEVPRGCAHVWAAVGHLRSAQQVLDEMAILHARKATPHAT